MVYFWLGRYCTNQLISLSEFPVIYDFINVLQAAFAPVDLHWTYWRTAQSILHKSWAYLLVVWIVKVGHNFLDEWLPRHLCYAPKGWWNWPLKDWDWGGEGEKNLFNKHVTHCKKRKFCRRIALFLFSIFEHLWTTKWFPYLSGLRLSFLLNVSLLSKKSLATPIG